MNWLALTGVVGPVFFVLLFTIDGFLRPGYSAIHQAISDLGSGPGAWILNMGLVIFGLFLILFAASFFCGISQISSGTWLKASALLLGLVGVGVMSDAFFLEDVFQEHPTTVHGLLHAISLIIAAASYVIALFIIGRKLRTLPQWQKYGWYSIYTSLLGFFFVSSLRWLRFVGILTASTDGLFERCLLVGALAWYIVMGYRLFVVGKSLQAVQADL